jgi:putative multiple sugar transport system permease protein
LPETQKTAKEAPQGNIMDALKKLFGGNTRQFGMIFALVALIILFQILTGGLTLTPDNVINLFNGNSYILILAIGMVLVIIAGHIDLSVGSIAAAVGIIVAITMRDWHLPTWVGIIFGLAIGAAIGVWQGFWVAYVGIPAFIVTLAGMLIFRGVNQFIGQSNTVPVPQDFQYIGAGYLPEIGPDTGYNNLTLLIGVLGAAFVVYSELRGRREAKQLGAEVPELWVTVTKVVLICAAILYATYLFATGRPGTSFPIPGIILGVLVLIYGFVSAKTIIGRHIYAVGGNRHAAELSGVQSKRVNFLVMMNMAILSALAGMVFVGRSTASGPFDGTGWELDAIAAVFIGGAAVTGGVGTVIGSIVGGLVMAVLNNGLQLLGIGADRTAIIKGLVLLAAVAFDVYNKSQGRRSIIGLLMRNGSNRAVPAQPDETTKTSEVLAKEA